MQTRFSAQQLAQPAMATSEAVIRKCVHCGFCTATCPTYVLLGDELDSPRGRIYLIKDLLENERTPTAEVVKHVDRCLSCLSCVTTCPSGVNYMHLVDHARSYIETHYRRPLPERLWRALLAAVLPYPRRFRAALALGRLARPLAPLLGRSAALQPLSAMLALTPARVPRAAAGDAVSPTAARAAADPALPARRGRVLLLQGCAEPVLQPQVRAATARLLRRVGYEVAFAAGEGCCGALVHHMGREAQALRAARRNVDAWTGALGEGIAAIVITAGGCGAAIKNYGHLLRHDPDYAGRAAQVAALARDVTELLEASGLPERTGLPQQSGAAGLTVAYHPACSLQHGQQITTGPVRLLESVGFRVKLPAEAHLCCGSAGTYNILQPVIAGQLAERKVAQLDRLAADVVATGNVGCAVQIAQRASIPVVHTVELLDWATGGPPPPGLLAIVRPAS